MLPLKQLHHSMRQLLYNNNTDRLQSTNTIIRLLSNYINKQPNYSYFNRFNSIRLINQSHYQYQYPNQYQYRSFFNNNTNSSSSIGKTDSNSTDTTTADNDNLSWDFPTIQSIKQARSLIDRSATEFIEKYKQLQQQQQPQQQQTADNNSKSIELPINYDWLDLDTFTVSVSKLGTSKFTFKIIENNNNNTAGIRITCIDSSISTFHKPFIALAKQRIEKEINQRTKPTK